MNPIPEAFIEQMYLLLGKEETQLLQSALSTSSPVSVRVNAEKSGSAEGVAVPWCPLGVYLKERPSFTFDPLFHSGTYYVQEASSMFLSHVLRKFISNTHSSSIVALDLCAAPGGKSTLTLSSLPQGSILIANEVVKQRANILAENLIKWGNPNTIVTNNYAEDFQALDPIFDLIICDVPCSGEGMFRKDPQSILEWSPQNVDTCWKRQRSIVQQIWPCLKPGGILIYSTCTYNTLENEENIRWIQQETHAEILDCEPDANWGITSNLLKGENFPCYHFFPHRTKGEGFFLAALRKADDDCNVAHIAKQKKQKHSKQKTAIPVEINNCILHSEQFNFHFDEKKQLFYAFPKNYSQLLEQAQSSLNVLHNGIQLAAIKGKNSLQPLPSLALSYSLNYNSFQKCELSFEQAISYLRTESLTLSSDTPNGYVLVTYKSHPLGFVKNLGTRANNLYPTEWRIRKQLDSTQM
ncbi:MAG: rRNA cytosine-C5-methyltransferase [Bacteroidaceae bacterium]|nr:rRNA cytosine-C5-methyltransferase [Bacteroidaceae bacterium]